LPKEFAEGGAAVALNYSADKEKSGSQRQAITACVTRLPVKRCAKDANNRTKSRVREGSFLWDDHRIRILGFTMIGGTYTLKTREVATESCRPPELGSLHAHP